MADNTHLPIADNIASITSLPIHLQDDPVLQFWDETIKRYWQDNPDLYAAVQREKQAQADAKRLSLLAEKSAALALPTPQTHDEPVSHATALFGPLRGLALRMKIKQSHQVIREKVLALNADITPRTKAHNRKSECTTLEDEQNYREPLIAAQLQTWRSLLPTLMSRLSLLPDHRRTKSVKHQLNLVMIYGLFAFIFKVQSRREMNRELTGAMMLTQLKRFFPEIDSIPHADTLYRLLSHINPHRIEAIQVSLIRDLIKKKKFKSLLIKGYLPISIDGTQKCYRDGLLQDERWCERKVGGPDNQYQQQYVYVLEANIILPNGLNIPLMSEFLYRENNELLNKESKQDNEITALERLMVRLKHYFPRLKVLLGLDAMFATYGVMSHCDDYYWQYVIRLPKKQLTDCAKMLAAHRCLATSLPKQPAYRKREQQFYWCNDVAYGDALHPVTVNLAACIEHYQTVDNHTGDIKDCFVEHCWLSSFPLSVDNAHEIINLAAKKQRLIEDSINTEKNREYHYRHVFAYDWWAMQGFHYLMRLAHAINALSEYEKTIKRYIRKLGCSATLSLIKNTLLNPWLSTDWYAEQRSKSTQLRLQLE